MTMNRWSFLTLLMICIGMAGAVSDVSAQVIGNQDKGLEIPAPQDRVLDEAGFFRDHPERRKEVCESLAAIEKKHQYPVYLAIYYNVIDGSLKTRAQELHRLWCGENRQGMVIVYQRDPVAQGNNPEVAFFQGSEIDLGEKSSVKETENMIPRRDAEMILAKVIDQQKSEDPDRKEVEYVSNIIFSLERELESYFAIEPPSWTDLGNLKAMLIFAGLIAAIGLVGMFCWKRFLGKDKESRRQYYFPDVKTGRRLGAPFGGGWTSERSFSPSSSQK